MRNENQSARISIATGLVLLLFAGASAAQWFLAAGPTTEITEDGLYPVDRSIMPGAWVKPEFDLTGYSKLYFLPATAEFRETRSLDRTPSKDSVREHFAISEARRNRLREQWAQAFHDALSVQRSFELVDYVGRDVLLVRGRLSDMASGIPPDVPGSSTVTVMYPWEGSIVLDVHDSMSDELLARTVDRRRVEGPIDATAVEAGNGIMLRRWAQLLSSHIGQLANLSRR